MAKHVHLEILPQPDDTTCGPTCLHAVYQYYGLDIPLEQVIAECPRFPEGGTLAVLLGCHALARGFDAKIYTFNLDVFDPTWFQEERSGPQVHLEGTASSALLLRKLQAELEVKHNPRFRTAAEGYMEFLELGGEIRMRDLTADLLKRYLRRSIPILTGLSATYLYRFPREIGPDCRPDDVNGFPVGHFVVLCDYNAWKRTVSVADPYLPNPLGEEHHYEVKLDRLVCAMLLGVITYDANLLIITPPEEEEPELPPPT